MALPDNVSSNTIYGASKREVRAAKTATCVCMLHQDIRMHHKTQDPWDLSRLWRVFKLWGFLNSPDIRVFALLGHISSMPKSTATTRIQKF